ncbi:hypothetical protein EON63_05715 [archaeon]|nr:MAG: hypothetical protein EON63_05715 [archaeon]
MIASPPAGIKRPYSDEAGGEATSQEDSTESKSDDLQCQPCNKKPKTAKRDQVLHWDDYFMAVSFLSAMRSKDPSTQVGACIVNEEKRIVGIGYNGFPKGCSDDELPWDREGDNELETKYPVSYPSFFSCCLLVMMSMCM